MAETLRKFKTLTNFGFTNPLSRGDKYIQYGSENMAKAEGSTDNKNKPYFKKKFGAVTATCWENKRQVNGREVPFYTVNIERIYKDKDDFFKSTPSIGLQDIPKAILALQESYKELTMKPSSEAE